MHNVRVNCKIIPYPVKWCDPLRWDRPFVVFFIWWSWTRGAGPMINEATQFNSDNFLFILISPGHPRDEKGWTKNNFQELLPHSDDCILLGCWACVDRFSWQMNSFINFPQISSRRPMIDLSTIFCHLLFSSRLGSRSLYTIYDNEIIALNDKANNNKMQLE